MASKEQDLLLTPEQIDKAFEDAFEKPITFDHKPTPDEIFALKLKAVAQAQLAKADPQGHYEQGKFEERQRIMKIFASFGKVQLEKPLSGEEFEALFD